jgi:hypothetical protein
LRVYYVNAEARGVVHGVPVGVRKRALIGCVAVVALLLYVFGPGVWKQGSPALAIRDEDHGLVDLASGEGTSAGGETAALPRRSESTGAAATASASFTHGRNNENFKAYQEAVELFAETYGDTIEHTNSLVHKMLMYSEGANTMTKTEAHKLGDLLYDMDRAPNSVAIESYPEGYEDCSSYLRAGATSLDLAADSIRRFNETADMEYMRDYRGLIAMYLRAVADAQWCVADHLHRA